LSGCRFDAPIDASVVGASNFFLLPNFFCYRVSMSVAPKETGKSSPAATVSIEEIQRCFPALARTYLGHPVAYFDGPVGTKVPRAVEELMNNFLYHHTANTHWVYPTSAKNAVIIDSARSVRADFLNAGPSCQYHTGCRIDMCRPLVPPVKLHHSTGARV